MRLFVAIKTSPSLNKAVKCCADSLALFGSGSFCQESSYHITLAFIGESDNAAQIAAALDRIKAQPFKLCLDGYGNFGSTYYVSVKSTAELCKLQEAVVGALEEISVDVEKRHFTPHITVARRYKSDMPPVIFVPKAEMTAEEITLMESKNGAYLPVFTKKL